MKIHIGYDEAMHEASLVCEYSIHKYAKYHLETYFLKLDELKQKGYYYRKDDDSASTDFAYSRFLVPFLNNHQGWSMFVDNDFLFVRYLIILTVIHRHLIRQCIVLSIYHINQRMKLSFGARFNIHSLVKTGVV